MSFDVYEGETLGIVGESGCGKSTTARLLVRLIEPDHGEVTFDGAAVGRRLAPSRSAPPGADGLPGLVLVAEPAPVSVGDPSRTGRSCTAWRARPARERAHELLRAVGLDPGLFANRYPHELSGGQRQRINIARALALEPRLVILDEAVSALDKSIGAQVLNLLAELKERFHLTYVFISHDLNVVRYISDRVMVMYLGKVVEIGDVETLYRRPQHPYTRALLSAMPSMDPSRRTLEAPLSGDPPNPINPPSGCRFRTRCPIAEDDLRAPGAAARRLRRRPDTRWPATWRSRPRIQSCRLRHSSASIATRPPSCRCGICA